MARGRGWKHATKVYAVVQWVLAGTKQDGQLALWNGARSA